MKKTTISISAFTWNVLKKTLRTKIHSNVFSTKILRSQCMFYTRYMEMKLNVSSFDKNHSMSTSGSNTRALFCMLCSQIVVHSSILLNWNSVDKRWGAVGWFQKLCCIYLIYICRLFSFRIYFQKISSISYRQLSAVSYWQLSSVIVSYRQLLSVIVSYRHPQQIWIEILHGTTSIYNFLLNFLEHDDIFWK